ncbi:AAA family ATPase [Enterocloster lavalensis]|uniref:AAA family ATPase n=1 Tax=Enterocloster lavalensis TaxID=460384 RepID=UPI002666B80B|nr:AAA family ATPase [Enterocloster lavalensis]
MEGRKTLPIGTDDFRKLRENNAYYVDKTLMIKDFLEMQDEVALVARPRRFGKTLNMTMLREFFDIAKDSKALFEGLAIMDTEYASQINSRPVIYFTFKNVKGVSVEELTAQLKLSMQEEYSYYERIFKGKLDKNLYGTEKFYETYELLMDRKSSYIYLSSALLDLTRVVYEFYGIRPVLLIDEYDQPIMSSYEYNYHEQLGAFFSNFYGSAMKGNPSLGQALITGVQRVAKESIFSQFNNPQVYTVIDKEYAPYFGLNEDETSRLLEEYGLELNEEVRRMYDGYRIGGIEMYNPWSIINYAKKGRLENYWVKTSANFLVKVALKEADRSFWKAFEQLIGGQEKLVYITLDTSFAERASSYSLWGLLVNAGYMTVTKWVDAETCIVKIPNGEVMSEFQTLIAEISGIERLDLQQMFACLLKRDMETFLELYRSIVISCTSYMDAKENAYHMLFLGMCITLRGSYKVTSNLEAGYGRSDITLQALSPKDINVIVEFKQGENIEQLKEDALRQILDNRYYVGLSGEVLCVGIAHDKKRCEMAYKVIGI